MKLLAAALGLATSASAVPVYVMMPLDVIQSDMTVRSDIPDALQTLAGIGVDGIMFDTWWGLVESSEKEYDFSPYVDLVNLAEDNSLDAQAVLSFHQCGGNVGDTCDIPIPQFVRDVGSKADIFYQDQDGHVDEEYVSLFVDKEPLFNGRTPLDMYTDFASAFSDAMGDLLGSTVTEIEVGMGPAGELRLPGYQEAYWSYPGVGEFQCYGSYALASLADAAAAAGHPEWGSAGPSNAGNYNSSPYDSDASFFNDDGSGDNYASDYGAFFLGWYSGALIDHGDAVLSAMRGVFGDAVDMSAKIAGIHWWHGDGLSVPGVSDDAPTGAAEMTSGYVSYSAIAAMLAKHDAILDETCLEMQDSEQASCNCQSEPFELVQQVRAAAGAAAFSGENALPRYDQTAYDTILSQSSGIHGFTYLRLDDTLMQSDNLATFQGFVESMHSL